MRCAGCRPTPSGNWWPWDEAERTPAAPSPAWMLSEAGGRFPLVVGKSQHRPDRGRSSSHRNTRPFGGQALPEPLGPGSEMTGRNRAVGIRRPLRGRRRGTEGRGQVVLGVRVQFRFASRSRFSQHLAGPDRRAGPRPQARNAPNHPFDAHAPRRYPVPVLPTRVPPIRVLGGKE
jgi:hypothetical protein